MRKSIALLPLLLISTILPVRAQTAVGQWRDCLDYSQIRHVVPAGNIIYGGALGGILCYDLEEHAVTRMSKGTGLNDVGIATMAYDASTRCLVVAYNNSNIDLVIDDHTYNLSDIKRADLSGDKSIRHIRFANGRGYLATGFGVVVIDLQRKEIKETWYLGAGGGYTPVYDLAFMDDSIYAATGEGLKRLARTESHPSVSDLWATDSRLAGTTVTTLENFDGKLLLAGYTFDPEQITLLVHTPTGYRIWNRGDILSMRVGGGKVTLTHEHSVVRYNNSLERYDSLTNYTWSTLDAYDAVCTDNGVLWVGHNWDGLLYINPDGTDGTCHLNGPFSHDHCFRLVPFNSRMMLCPGGHSPIYTATYYEPNLLTAYGREWSSLDKSNGLLDHASDLLDAAVNPRDTTETVAALWGAGAISIRNNKVQTLYDTTNTDGALVPLVSGDYRRLLIGSVAFDRQGNLWVLSSHSTHALAVRRTNGQWKGFETQQMTSAAPALDKLVCDSIDGYLWFMGRDNVIYVHDGNNRMARVNPNNGSKLSTETVTALVQDQNGNLWLGTNKGIKVIYDGYKAFQNGGNGEISPVTCSNITISNGEFAEYLMAYESITAIAVDGANRKWVGTANGGLYLISANGLEQLEHFTSANSPLFADRIVCLGINERTGEVYIGTERGLQVYRGTATYADKKPLDEVHVFPNPVRPDYDGPISATGFTRNGKVHITDAAGHTVFSTTANGGQVTWNGRTLNGERVASGVYYIFASDEEGNNRSVGRILIIR